MEVGVKECFFKKQLVRSTWGGNVKNNGIRKNGKESRCPEIIWEM